MADSEQVPSRSFVTVRGVESTTGKKEPTGYLITLMHLIKGYVGTGIFALGLAFKHCGIIVGPSLLAVVALISVHCQHQLVQAAERIASKESVEVLPNFAEVVQYTFEDSSAKWMRKMSKGLGILTNIFLIIAEYGSCAVYFIFVAKHLKQIGDEHGFIQDYRIWLLMILGPMWLSTFISSLKILMPLSLFANVANWLGIAVFMYYVFKPSEEPIPKKSLAGTIEEYPLYFGTVLFAFMGITFIIQLRAEMRDPQQFVRPLGVLNVGVVIVYLLYVIVGILAYWRYGKCVEGSVFLNMNPKEIVAQTTKALMSLAVMFTFTFHMYVPFEIIYPIFYKKYGPFKHPLPGILLYKSAAVLITFAAANITEDLGAFISLFGALAGGVLSMVFPPALELAAFKGQLTVWLIIKNILIMVVGIVGSLMGTGLSVKEVIDMFGEKEESVCLLNDTAS